jgi:hypothetical protein
MSTSDIKVPGDFAKLFRMPDNTVVAATGTYSVAVNFIRWLAAGSPDKQPDLNGDAQVIQFFPKDIIRVYCGYSFFDRKMKFMAWGSGSPSALGALHAGATAKQAAKIGTLVDCNSGGKIVTMAVKP